jgi:hypothetical protein
MEIINLMATGRNIFVSFIKFVIWYVTNIPSEPIGKNIIYIDVV